ncbi:Urease accessory protein UreF [Candidatus Rhodobacter oscarellae]|uniref:Urease accessory protein UreF n=1 Tax=Candidatus Rhodobacter oscarellae TaxID=1675527 RepID=A0A0J9E7Y9_9RHOB|nr:urease accessory UreF family protein [Candidatus Rhodobacter lobularis]KMW58842.1 Urease accessory protein UreF [Candidatus Rhodobacter lobularis]
MTTDLLTLAQWLSPAYPVGAFAYSHGLEEAISAGTVSDAQSLSDWVTTVLQHGSGWNDALLLAAAFHAAMPDEVDATARALAASKERLQETDQQGAAFAATTSEVWGIDLPDLTYPVAVGRAASLMRLPLPETSALYLQAFASTLVSVGVRLIPLGQTAGARITQRAAALCAGIASDTQSGDLDRLTSTAFLADIGSMRHETLYSRTFRT